MRNELLTALRKNGGEIVTKTFAWVRRFPDGEHVADLASFFAAHPGLSLPDDLLGAGKGEICVSLHTPEFDGVPHCHDFVEIVYVCRGGVTDCIGGDRVVLAEGDACIHDPSAVHSITCSGDGDVLLNILLSRRVFSRAVYTAMVRDEKLDTSLDRYMTDGNGGYRVFRGLTAETGTIAELLVNEFFRVDGYSETVMETILLLLFAELLRNYGHREEDSFGGRLENWLSGNLQGATVTSCAAQFGYHPKYFSALVRRKTGKTFGELLMACRVKKAASHLVFTDCTVSRIAEMVGYRDAVSLYENFRRVFGVSPGEYRARERNL